MRTVTIPTVSSATVVRATAVFGVGTVVGITVNSTAIEAWSGFRIRGAGSEARGADEREEKKREVFHEGKRTKA
jgi:hypothetical protein